MKNRATRITTLIILFPLITLLLYGALSHLFFFYIKNKDISHELARYEKVLMDAQKKSLVEKVENLTRFIRYYNYRSSDRIKKEVKSIVNVVARIANNIYHSNKGKMEDAALKSLIVDALKQVRFEKDMGYLFMQDMQGNAWIHSDPAIIGTNTSNLRDVNGKYLIKEFMGVLEEKGEGFVDYYWHLPGKDKKEMYYKITFVKMLDMFDWYIGAGEYLKYMTRQVSQEILAYIRDNAYFRGGYLFVSDSQNRILFHPDDNQTEDLNQLRMEGIYADKERIAFTAYVAEYDWYITAVQNLKEIQETIAQKREQSLQQISRDIRTNLYLVIAMWLVSLLFSLYLSSIVNRKLKQYEEKLNDTNNRLIFQSRQALIGELFSMIAHQWRQPINKIASILALLRFGAADEKPDYKMLDQKFQEIEESVEFMSDTIDDFRTFYQPKEDSEMVDMKLLIQKAVDFLSGNIRKKDIEIILHLEEISCEMYGNEFLQVMINLIKNATDAVRQRGKITVSLFHQDGEVLVSVEDDGTGIAEELVSKIFDPYFSTKIDSMGLGLYMTKMITERHLGGSIEVVPLEQGTRFILRFTCNRR